MNSDPNNKDNSNNNNQNDIEKAKEELIRSYFGELGSRHKLTWNRINSMNLNVPWFKVSCVIICAVAWLALLISYFRTDYYTRTIYGALYYSKLISGTFIGLIVGAAVSYYNYYLAVKTDFMYEARNARLKNLINTWQFQKRNLYYNGWMLAVVISFILYCYYSETALLTSLLALNLPMSLFDGEIKKHYSRILQGYEGQAAFNDGGETRHEKISGRFEYLTTVFLGTAALLVTIFAFGYASEILMREPVQIITDAAVLEGITEESFHAVASPAEPLAAVQRTGGAAIMIVFSMFLISASVSAIMAFFSYIAGSLFNFFLQPPARSLKTLFK